MIGKKYYVICGDRRVVLSADSHMAAASTILRKYILDLPEGSEDNKLPAVVHVSEHGFSVRFETRSLAIGDVLYVMGQENKKNKACPPEEEFPF